MGRAASAAMMAAACAARRSPSCLNGMSSAASPAATARNAFATRAMTIANSSAPKPDLSDFGKPDFGCFWRKSRMVGYHGLSSRLSSQRQSVTHGSSTQTGLPRLPAGTLRSAAQPWSTSLQRPGRACGSPA